jgi:hypothetical protein
MLVIVAGVLAVLAIALLGSFARTLRKDRRPTQPLASIAGLYGSYLFLCMVALAVSLAHGLSGSACVDAGNGTGSGGAARGYTARPGASLAVPGDVSACALHPGLGQRGLFLLAREPGLVLWGCLLLMIWRLIRQANSNGPFTPRAAAVMRQLGWVLIGGSIIAGALGHLGADLLARMLMTPAPFDARGIVTDVLLYGPLRALLPVPALAGAALLTFARITRAGAVLEDEIKATI